MTASSRTGTLDLSPNAVTVLERRYLLKDDQGKAVEQPEDLFWRVARTIAEPEPRYGASDKAVEGRAETLFEQTARGARGVAARPPVKHAPPLVVLCEPARLLRQDGPPHHPT